MSFPESKETSFMKYFLVTETLQPSHLETFDDDRIIISRYKTDPFSIAVLFFEAMLDIVQIAQYDFFDI